MVDLLLKLFKVSRTNNKFIYILWKGLTMSRLFYFCLAFFLAMSIANAQSIGGKWKGEMQGPNGSFEFTYNFHVVGDSLTGSLETQMGEIPITNGKINGKKFSFDTSFNNRIISHQCTIMGDSISMKSQGMRGEREIILKQLPESNNESK
jgi:hypothetical protein